MSKNHNTTAAKVTKELFNSHLIDPVSMQKRKEIQQEFHKYNLQGRAAIVKPLITENNAKKPKRWGDDHKTWTYDDRKYVIWSDESSFTLFPTSGQVYVCRMPKEAYIHECLVPTVKHEGRSVMILAAISLYPTAPIITLNGQITAND